MLVVFVTAEEKGLLGSDYFARHPVKAAGQMIADVNLDMPVFMTPSNDLVAFGSENSTLDAIVKRAAQAEGYVSAPDPMPEENIFVRSDQYSFVKQGVPAVYLMPGFTPIDPKSTTPRFEEFRKQHYHKPSDDLSLPMDLDALARFTRVNYRVIAAIADDPVAPRGSRGTSSGRCLGRERTELSNRDSKARAYVRELALLQYVAVCIRRPELQLGHLVPRPSGSSFSIYFSTPNLYTVVVLYSCPGRRTTDGKAGLFGESG